MNEQTHRCALAANTRSRVIRSGRLPPPASPASCAAASDTAGPPPIRRCGEHCSERVDDRARAHQHRECPPENSWNLQPLCNEHFSAKEILCGPTPAPEGSESRDLPLVVEALAHACTAELFLSAVCVRAVCAVRAVCMKARMLPVAVPRCPGSIRCSVHCQCLIGLFAADWSACVVACNT